MDNTNNKIKEELAEGIHIARTQVAPTIGGRGTNATIEHEKYPFYIQTKDAFSIIQALRSDVSGHKLAFSMMRDATDSMNKKSKDGRTTMCILTDEIVQEAIKSGRSGNEIEEDLNSLLDSIDKEIDGLTKEITVEEVEDVARTAADSDRLGKLVADIYKKAGKDCLINHIEASGTLEDYVLYTEGVRFRDTGFLTDTMVHDEVAKKANRREVKAVYENPKILVTKRKINTEEEIGPVVEALLKRGEKNLIIFTDDMDSQVATSLINTHKSGVMNICIIKAPILWKGYVFEDFAKVTGSTIIEDATGINFKNIALEHLGTCTKIVIDREDTIITPSVDYSEHINELKSRDDNDSKLRLWWLTAKTATIRLGANNEGELSLLRLKLEDAIHSSQLALESGIVAGGGVCLMHVANKLDNPILKVALKAPIREIMNNAGIKDGIKDFSDGDIGFDAKTKKPVHMFEIGIVDAAVVVKNAVRNAVAIASRVLTTHTFVNLQKPTLEEMQMEILARKQMPMAGNYI